MKLIKGQHLTPQQVKQVKAAFIYRWTIENKRQAESLFARHSFNPPTIEPVTDEQWIKEHAFYFKKDGSLSDKPRFAEPVYMAVR